MDKPMPYLEVIAGPMYCGKTEELIRLVKRATIGKKHVQVFKHQLDVRYGTEKKLFSHAGLSFDCELVGDSTEILAGIKPETQIVAIDETQWFGESLIAVVRTLLEQGRHVIVAGLAMTFDRKPFTPMPELMAMADTVTKLSSVCMKCGADAVFHKKVTNGTTVDSLVADPAFVTKLSDAVYEARCRTCYDRKP